MGWASSGLQITALQDTVLQSFTFNNQGQSDSITLMDMTTNSQVGVLYVTPSMSAYTVTPNWPLQSGHQYRLTNTNSNNGRWASYSGYPIQNGSISVDGMISQDGTLYTEYWFTFTTLITESCN